MDTTNERIRLLMLMRPKASGPDVKHIDERLALLRSELTPFDMEKKISDIKEKMLASQPS